MSRQQRIKVPPHKEPTAEGHDCEWCGDPAKHAIQRHRKTGKGYLPLQQYLYACESHRVLARNYAYPT